MTRLTVLMPVRNQSKYVGEAIKSILAQTFNDFELLIIDDGSTEETPAILRGYADRDARVRVLLRPHRGIPATRNELLEQARTSIVAWIDSDDIATPERLRKQFDVMSRDEDLWVLGTSSVVINENGHRMKTKQVITGARNVAHQMKRGCKVAQSSCMMRRDPIVKLGGYRPAFAYSQDYDLFLRVSEKGKIDNIEFVGLHYRAHTGNVTSNNSIYQDVLAEFARASHARRVAGRPDPVNSLMEPPDLFTDPILQDLLGDKVPMYRALERAAREIGDVDDILRALLNSKLYKKQRSAYQKAIVGLVRRRPFDLMSATAILRAAAVGPGTLVRRLWSWTG